MTTLLENGAVVGQKKNPVFVSWIDFHGRSEGIARRLGIEEWSDGGGSGPLPLRYLRLWVSTWKYLRRYKPTEVIVMQPPVVALLAVRSAVGKNVRICGDLHTGTFYDPKWKWSTKLVAKLLGAPNLAIVTNDALAVQAQDHGAEALVLHDLIETYPEVGELGEFEDQGLAQLQDKKYVLVPITYSYDEPLEELAAATHLAAGVVWVFTGRAPESFSQACNAANTVFPGFVSREEYLRLLGHANVLLAPTTEEDTMQRAGYEAMCAGKALVTSDTEVLRDFFGEAALTVPPRAELYADAANDAVRRQSELEGSIIELRTRRVREQSAALQRLSEWIHNDLGTRE
ncbi:glycosyltransferase [Paenarthrobacter nitroguajacolicus]|uniref:Glycosyltransferase n=1 Tax=Paenarthrobacter nitroguajacolicus TaxID=211146 RepID=A0A558GZT2_PAENT|nr:glycosyltransferase [Paenarthrobacter nitroguajacolicus]TVU62378.1 glycosyltransferase [Paenarthrobacter nitroguajacolicus]